MPTGYTAGVQDGSITDFREYALKCARAFGACVTLRDEPLSAEIPEFEPSLFHLTSLEEARRKLYEWNVMTDEERFAMQVAEHADRLRHNAEGRQKTAEQRRRYEAMLDKAKAFVAPTEDHKEFASFLVSQLEQSIDFDCNDEYFCDEPLQDFDYWKNDKHKSLKSKVEYHVKKWKEEQRRTNSRNEWVRQLRGALEQQSVEVVE